MTLTALTILTTEVLIEGTTRLNLVVVYNSQIVGSCFIDQWDKPGGWISYVFVPEEYRRKGIARLMIEECLKKTREAGKEAIGLMVNSANTVAMDLYHKLGFRVAYTYADGPYLMTYHFVQVPI